MEQGRIRPRQLRGRLVPALMPRMSRALWQMGAGLTQSRTHCAFIFPRGKRSMGHLIKMVISGIRI